VKIKNALDDAHAGFVRDENENVVEIDEHHQRGGVDKNFGPAFKGVVEGHDNFESYIVKSLILIQAIFEIFTQNAVLLFVEFQATLKQFHLNNKFIDFHIGLTIGF
jgi:hypothetical protein